MSEIMSDAEFKDRYRKYKDRFITSVTPPECKVCSGEAELYDIAAEANYCEDCLIDELNEPEGIIFFKEHTE